MFLVQSQFEFWDSEFLKIWFEHLFVCLTMGISECNEFIPGYNYCTNLPSFKVIFVTILPPPHTGTFMNFWDLAYSEQSFGKLQALSSFLIITPDFWDVIHFIQKKEDFFRCLEYYCVIPTFTSFYAHSCTMNSWIVDTLNYKQLNVKLKSPQTC